MQYWNYLESKDVLGLCRVIELHIGKMRPFLFITSFVPSLGTPIPMKKSIYNFRSSKLPYLLFSEAQKVTLFGFSDRSFLIRHCLCCRYETELSSHTKTKAVHVSKYFIFSEDGLNWTDTSEFLDISILQVYNEYVWCKH